MTKEPFYKILDEAHQRVVKKYPGLGNFYTVHQNLHVGFIWNFIFGQAGSKESIHISYLVGNEWLMEKFDEPVVGLNAIPLECPKELGPEKAIEIARNHGVDGNNDYIQLSWNIGNHAPQWLMNIPQGPDGHCINAMVSVPSGDFSTCKCQAA